MNARPSAFWAERTKAFLSPIYLITAAATILFPLVGAGLLAVAQATSAGGSWGILATKARLAGLTPDWPSFLRFLSQAVVAGQVFLQALMIAWLFGREWTDRTLKLLLAVPASRQSLVGAKIVLILIWNLGAWGLFMVSSFLVGTALGLAEFSGFGWLTWLRETAIASLLTGSLGTWTAYFASRGRGYLAPLAWAVVTVALAQIGLVIGVGDFVPWSIPALAAGIPGLPELTVISVVLVLAASGAGGWMVLHFWTHADHPR